MSFEGGDFDGWLERGLDRALNAQSGPSPLATQASYHAASISGGTGVSFGTSVVSALTSKLVAGTATAALVVGGGTVVAATAATGSANPTNWGQFISQTVVPDCKASAAKSGHHGIGACVSSIAREHGEAVSSAARHHGATEAHQNHGKASEARDNKPDGAGSTKPGGSQGNDNGDKGQANAADKGSAQAQSHANPRR